MRCSTIRKLSARNGGAVWAWRIRQLSSRGIEGSRLAVSQVVWSRVEWIFLLLK